VPAAQLSRWQGAGNVPSLHDLLHIYLNPTRLNIVPEFGVISSEIPGVFGVYDPQIEALGRSFLDELTQRTIGEQLYVDALTTLLALHLVRRYSRIAPPEPSLPRSKLGVAELRQVTEYIEAMLRQPLTLTELARIVHLSPHHFARVFKRTTGQSPHQYVLARRVERARQLLVLGHLPIADIADLVGFADQSHLTAQMRRQLGVTPRQLRDSARSF
jgi:AraC family transcriptional regulator